MKLDRNINEDGHGKYALVLLRNLRAMPEGEEKNECHRALDMLLERGILDLGDIGGESEFFVLRLRDMFAANALITYAELAQYIDPEWASEVRGLAARAAKHPNKKQPD